MTILVRNGQVIDGSGKSPFRSDVFVSGKKISALGIFPNKKADIVIDAGGGFITPGFIDVHNTSDHFLSFHSGFDPGNLFSQGVTTVIGGNCGVSLAPFSRAGSVLLGSYSRSGMNADWRDVDELFNHFRKRPLGVNFATLIGYETFRRGVNFPSRPNKKFLSGLLPRISGLLSQGAAGISFGLSHSRNSKFSLPELLLLANSCAGKSRVLSGCLSVPEGDIAFETEEFIGVAGKHGLRGLITEFMPRMGMGSYERALEILEKLPPEGNIRFQCHPFDSSSYEIAEFLPDWVRKNRTISSRSSRTSGC
jgi:N-acyl-D-amino-acid deacylase